MKRWFSLFLVMLVCIVTTACGQTDTSSDTAPPLTVTGDAEVAVLQLGKADAIVITTATKTVVIDAGEIEDGGKVLNYLNQKGRSVIDYLIITHYDRDHVGGAARLLEFSKVKHVLRPNYMGERAEYAAFLAAIQERKIPDTPLTAGSEDLTFMVEDMEFTVNVPSKTAYTNEEGVQQDNNFSLVVRARHGAKSFLFAADCEDARLAELIVNKKPLTADFLKLPYHGNYTELTATFLERVNPSYAVACDSDKNPMATETAAFLAGIGAKPYATRNGTVVCHSDGITLTVTQQTAK